MSVPECIRQVPRPKNTVVVRAGKQGPSQYAVRERKGYKLSSNGNPMPINGRTVGHIVDGRFIALASKSVKCPDMASFGASAFVRSCSMDLLDDLYAAYPVEEAWKIMAIASLRVLKPQISNKRLLSEYSRTFISHYYPGIALSENSVCQFLQKLGQNGALRQLFYEKRIQTVQESHHVIIDGMLKQDTSSVNDLSAFSHKARIKGCKDISILYAYDLESQEPVCAEVFPGNCIDASSYRSFIVDNNLQKGLIIADKGFPPKQIAQELKERPQLHFLTPLKRNDTRILAHQMYDFEGVLKNVEGSVFFRKVAIRGDRYLYSFRDTQLAAKEEKTFAEKAKTQEAFQSQAYSRKKIAFGTIVFESDQDLDPEVVYHSYACRWKIELVFRRYKNDECLDQTRVQGDFSVIGSEFINFIATLLTCRMLQKAQKAQLFEQNSWSDLMDDLSSAWRRLDGSEPPQSDDSAWVHTIPKVMKLLVALGLCKNNQEQVTAELKLPGRRGRPKGSKNKKTLEREAQQKSVGAKP